MNIYQLLRQRFGPKDVSIHIFFNEDSSITTIVEPKFKAKDKDSEAAISITALTEETAIAKLAEALDTANKIAKQEKVTSLEATESEDDDDKDKTKKETPKQKSDRIKKEKKEAEDKKKKEKLDKAAAEKEAKEKEKSEAKAAKDKPKPTKEELAREEKIQKAFGKFNEAVEKKDDALIKFWYAESETLLKDYDSRHDEKFKEMTDIVSEIDRRTPEKPEPKIEVEAEEQNDNQPAELEPDTEKQEILAEEIQTPSSDEEDEIPMPV